MNQTYKIALAAILVASVTCFAGGAILAKGNGGNTKFLNGKPFSTLNTQIQQNSVDILALQDRTAELRLEMNALNQDMQALKTLVGTYDARIAQLESDIAGVVEELRAVANEVERLNGELLALMADSQTNAAAIAELDARLNTLHGDFAALSQSLASMQASVDADLATLNAKVEEYKAQSDAVNALVQQQIVVLQAKIEELSQAAQGGVTVEDLAEINLQLAGLLSQIIGLEVEVNQNTTNILGLQTQVTNSSGGADLGHVHPVTTLDYMWDTLHGFRIFVHYTLTGLGQIP